MAVISGGYKDGKAQRRILVVDPSSGYEETVVGSLEIPRFGHTSHTFGDDLYLIGGVSDEDFLLPALTVFSLTTKYQRNFALDGGPDLRVSS